MLSKRAFSFIGKSSFTGFQVFLLCTRPTNTWNSKRNDRTLFAATSWRPEIVQPSSLVLGPTPKNTVGSRVAAVLFCTCCRRPLTGHRFAPCFSGRRRAQGGRPEPRHGRQAVEPRHGAETETRVRRDGDRQQPGRQSNSADGVPVRHDVAPGVENIHARLHRYGITAQYDTDRNGGTVDAQVVFPNL